MNPTTYIIHHFTIIHTYNTHKNKCIMFSSRRYVNIIRRKILWRKSGHVLFYKVTHNDISVQAVHFTPRMLKETVKKIIKNNIIANVMRDMFFGTFCTSPFRHESFIIKWFSIWHNCVPSNGEDCPHLVFCGFTIVTYFDPEVKFLCYYQVAIVDDEVG